MAVRSLTDIFNPSLRRADLHHYLPTLYFATIMLAHLLDHFLWNPSTARYRSRGGVRAQLSEARQNLAFAALVGLIFVVFLIFKDTAYGREGRAEHWPLVKWRKSWNVSLLSSLWSTLPPIADASFRLLAPRYTTESLAARK